MATFMPVDGDPFATAPAQTQTGPGVVASPSSPALVPVDHDPFAAPAPMEFDDPITAAAYAKANGTPAAGPSYSSSSGIVGAVTQALRGSGSGPASGWSLPVSFDAAGNPSFDSNAGFVGMAKGAVTNAWSAASRLSSGNVDPSNPEDIDRSFDMAGLLSPINPAARAGDMAIPGVTQAFTPGKVTPPTADALRAAASSGYDSARAMGVEYSSPSVAAMANGVQQDLNANGILPVLAPKTHAILDSLQAVPAGQSSTVPFGNLDAARKAFGHASQDFANPTEQYAAKTAQNAIDGFVTKADPSSVVAGPAAAASDVITQARANAAAGFRSDRLNGIVDAAGLSAAAANSGANIGNATRARVKSLLLSDSASSGYNPDEIAALRGVTNGTPVSNTARALGNLLGGGGGMHGANTALAGALGGYEMGGTPGAIAGAGLPIFGMGAKALDNSLTAGRLTAADELVRQRSPLYQALSANAPPELDSAAKRAALLRAMMLQGQQPQTGADGQ
jgi:hypothetical protein